VKEAEADYDNFCKVIQGRTVLGSHSGQDLILLINITKISMLGILRKLAA
jgi:hypothetical protein